MPISTTDLNKAYLAYFGRPADFTGQTYFANKTQAEVIAAFDASPESKAMYGDDVTTKVNAIYNNLFNRDAEPAGLKYWVAEIQSGRVTPAGAAITILNSALGSDITAVANKLSAASAFVAALDTTPEIVGYSGAAAAESARVWLKTVSDTPASLTNAVAGVDVAVAAAVAGGASAPNVGADIRLTVGADFGAGFTGTSLADTFKANVVQNAMGAQVNTLGSGDELNGGGGIDTLNAKITAGAFTGGSLSMPIQAETKSIEIAKLQAVNSDITGTNTNVYVNAKDMLGVTKIASNYSDANLVIQNLTTKDDAGLARNVSEMTVGMEYTGNADSHWQKSDMSVYFDQDYLSSSITRTQPIIEMRLMNEDAYDVTKGQNPLDGVFIAKMAFTLNGTSYDLAEYIEEDAAGSGSEIKTYAELLAAVQVAVAALKEAHPDDAALQSLQAVLGNKFLSDISPSTGNFREGFAIRLNVDGLTDNTANTLTVSQTDLTLNRAEAATVENNNRYERAESVNPTEGERLNINVDLEKVGLAGDGGDLVIGSMNKAPGNVWNAKTSTTQTKSGIEEFNVTVHGANDKSSSLAGLHSTNNNLRVVTVATDAALAGASFANLTIGNTQTAGLTDVKASLTPSLVNANALKDVQKFDASGFKGDLSVHAALTSEITAKYLNLKDQAPNAANADNVNFEYTGGTGNDSLNIALSDANLSAPGTTSREDFNLNIQGGAGNDTITLGIVNGSGLSVANTGDNSNWYHNSTLNANLRIDGGDGNDTIWTPGSGNVVILAGTGNDTVYTDNTGAKATWAFNVADHVATPANLVLNNLKSDANNQYNLYKTQVQVTFKGIEVKELINSTNGIARDLDINQAIKKAINSDAVLSKLLVATDGPSNTLVVTSLIDGAMSTVGVNDLAISFIAPTVALPTDTNTTTKLIAGDAVQLAGWYKTTGDAAAFASVIAAQVTSVNAKNDYASAFAKDGGLVDIAGVDSIHTSDNTINLGTGNDVLVLGTGVNSNETVKFDAGFGNDTIVNFAAAGTGMDHLDFSGINGTTLTAAYTTDKGINIQLATTLATSATVTAEQAIASLYSVNNLVAQNHVFVSVDSTNNVGTVYSVTDAIGATNAVATLEGKIDLADTNWFDLIAANFLPAGGLPPVVPPVVVPPVGGFTVVDLGTTNVTATAAAESFVYDFQMVAGRATKAGDGEVVITGFDVTKDKLVFNDIGTGAVLTEAQFKALPGVVIAENPFANNTSIYFDAAAGILGGVTLVGIVDAALTTVAVETTA